MKYFIIIFSYCFSFSLSSRVIYTDYKKITSINTSHYKGIEISKEKCPKNICLAAKIISESKKKLLNEIFIGSGGANPTASLCHLVKGTAISYYLKNRDAISICMFSDTSFFMSWDFLRYLKSK